MEDMGGSEAEADPASGATSKGGVGGVVTVLRWSRRHKWALGSSLTAALALACGPAIWVRASAAGDEYSPQTVPQTPVALVLGARVYPDGNPSPYLRYRLDLAVQLYRAGKVRVLLVSGDNRTSHYDEPTAMQRYLIANGIPAGKVVRDFAGRDTYDSCVRAQKVFGVRQVTVISQQYHLHRALALCRAIGLDAVGVGDVRGKDSPSVWRYGALREQVAAIKAAYDVLISRTPILGPPLPDVQRALDA